MWSRSESAGEEQSEEGCNGRQERSSTGLHHQGLREMTREKGTQERDFEQCQLILTGKGERKRNGK